MGKKEGGLPVVTVKTEKGPIELELYASDAPATVQNFLKLVRDGFYNGLRFHRIVDDFVVQVGCPHSKNKGDPRAGSGGPGWQIKCETRGNPRRHADGALSMAHAGTDTGGSQFFIVLNAKNCRHLDGMHTVFGHVTDGMDIVRGLSEWDLIESAKVSDSGGL